MNQKSAGDGGGDMRFHISTKGIDRSLFMTPEDFRQAINIIATCAAKYNVVVFAYCLMSNHVHIVGEAAPDAIVKFINSFKQNYSRYFARVHHESKIFRGVPVSITELKTKQDLRNCIAYILRNPVEAKICYNADQYPWSSYGCYFKDNDISGLSGNNSFGSFSRRRLMDTLRTHVDMMSKNVSVTNDGYVIPESFVEVPFVEELFGNSRDELAKCIAVNPYLALEFELTTTSKIGFTHYELVKIASELAEINFGKRLSVLNMQERASMILSLYSDYNASPYQICQVLSLSRKSVYPILGLPLDK